MSQGGREEEGGTLPPTLPPFLPASLSALWTQAEQVAEAQGIQVGRVLMHVLTLWGEYLESRYKATWNREFNREFNLPWREASPPNHLNDKWTRTSRLSIKKPLSLSLWQS